MSVKVAINGYGRIGRALLRILLQNPAYQGIELVAINDLGDAATLAHLTRYDSTFGPLLGELIEQQDHWQVGPHHIRLLAEKDPSRLPWQALGVDLVLECSGKFKQRVQAAAHLSAGAKRVLVSHPMDDADLTFAQAGRMRQARHPVGVVEENEEANMWLGAADGVVTRGPPAQLQAPDDGVQRAGMLRWQWWLFGQWWCHVEADRAQYRLAVALAFRLHPFGDVGQRFGIQSTDEALRGRGVVGCDGVDADMDGVFPGGQPAVGTPGAEADGSENEQQDQDAELAEHAVAICGGRPFLAPAYQ